MEPPNIVFTQDWQDPITNVKYTHGTILKRNKLGQYCKLGSKLGDWCVSDYYLLQDVTKVIDIK